MKIYFAAFFASLTFGLCWAVFVMNEETSEALRAVLTTSSNEMPEPVAMLAIAPGERLADELNYVVSAFGMSPYQCGFVAGAIEKLLTGIDRTRPIGAYLMMDQDSEDPEYVVALPVDDIENFKKSIAQLGTVDESEWGTTVQFEQGDLLMLQQVDDYVFISNEKDCLHQLPSQPEQLFNSLLDVHTISLQINGQQIPLNRKDVFWAAVKAGAKSGLVRQESPVELEHTLSLIKGLIYDVEYFKVNFTVNEQKKSLGIGTEVVGTEGSWIRERANKNLTMEPTRFAGFRQKNAAFNLLSCSNTSAEDLRAWKNNVDRVMDQLRSSAGGPLPEFPDWLTHLEATFEDTLNSDRVDLGATLVLRKGKANFAMAAYVADTSHLDNLISEACRQIDETQAPTTYRTAFAEHRGIVFHEFVGELDIDEIRQSFGKNPRMTIGVGPQAVYLAFGESGFEVLKSCIDDTVDSKPSDLMVSYADVSLTPLLSMMGDHPFSRYAANLARGTKGYDKLQMRSSPVENGFASRLDVHSGFVKTIVESIGQIGAYASKRASGPIRVDSATQRTQTPFSSMERAN